MPQQPDHPFLVLRHTASHHLLLESQGVDGPVPVSQPVKGYLGRKHAVTIIDTIGSVKAPYYLAKPIQGTGEALVGKAVQAAIPRARA